MAGRSQDAIVLVARIGDSIVGSATLVLDREPLGSGRMRMLGVDPAWQRRGAGRALVVACADMSRTAAKRTLILHTLETMSSARHLYDSLGFRRLADRDVDGMRLLTYELEL